MLSDLTVRDLQNKIASDNSSLLKGAAKWPDLWFRGFVILGNILEDTLDSEGTYGGEILL